MPTRFACLLCLFLLVASLRAQTTIHIPADQPTIQAGINAAHDGDTVLIAPGTYNENIDFKGKAITVISSDGPAQTTINGNAQSATVSFQNGEGRNSVLKGLTITGGGGDFFASRGGVYALHSSPSILDNVISGAGCNGIASVAAAPSIINNSIERTHVDPATMGGCTDANGSAIWINGTDASLIPFPTAQGKYPEVIRNTIQLNTEAGAVQNGLLGAAGISVMVGASPLIQDNRISNNAPAPVVIGTVLTANGGIQVAAASAVIVQNLVYGNDGGGIAIGNYGTLSGPVILVNNTVVNNTLEDFPESLGGVPGSARGSQLRIGTVYPVTLSNNIFFGATTASVLDCSAGLNLQGVPPTLTFLANDVYNGLGSATSGMDGGSCNLSPGTNGNLSVDPGFVNALSTDFHLALTSSLIDAGDNNALDLLTQNHDAPLSTDLDGNPRVQNATGTSIARIDMGAYEALGTTPPNPPTQPTPPTQTATQTVLTAAPNPAYVGQSVAISIKVSASGGGTPTGAVNLYDGSTLLATPLLNTSGQATFSTASLAVGSHSLTATFSAQGNFLASTSPALQETVLASGFTLALTPTALTVPTGASASVNVALASLGNFSGPLTLSTGALPPNLSANFSTSTATLSPGQTVSVSLKLNADAKTSRNQAPHFPRGRSWPAVALALLLPVTLRKRQELRRSLYLVVAFALLPWISGCTTLRTPLDETPVAVTSYTLPVIATDAQGHQQTARLALTITP